MALLLSIRRVPSGLATIGRQQHMLWLVFSFLRQRVVCWDPTRPGEPPGVLTGRLTFSADNRTISQAPA